LQAIDVRKSLSSVPKYSRESGERGLAIRVSQDLQTGGPLLVELDVDAVDRRNVRRECGANFGVPRTRLHPILRLEVSVPNRVVNGKPDLARPRRLLERPEIFVRHEPPPHLSRKRSVVIPWESHGVWVPANDGPKPSPPVARVDRIERRSAPPFGCT